MAQVDIMKTFTFSKPVNGCKGYGFTPDGTAVIINEDGTTTPIATINNEFPNIIANLGVGPLSGVPGSGLKQGDIYVSNDTNEILTAVDSVYWQTEALHSGQFVTDIADEDKVLYQYDGNALNLLARDGYYANRTGSNLELEEAPTLNESNEIIFKTATGWFKRTLSNIFSLISKNTVGLSNVDNTSDLNKPISTLQQAEFTANDNDHINSASYDVNTDILTLTKKGGGNITVSIPIVDTPLLPEGEWNASTNTPDISSATTGQFWIVTTAGTQFTIDWAVNDWAVKTATGWAKVDNQQIQPTWSNVTGKPFNTISVNDFVVVGNELQIKSSYVYDKHNAASEAAIIDTDYISFFNSVLRKITFANLKATLLTYFRTQFADKRFQTLTSSASITMNVNDGANAKLSLAHNATITFSNLTAGDQGEVIIDNTGSYTATITPTPYVIGFGAGVVNISASNRTIISYKYDGAALNITYGTNYTNS